MHFLNQNRCIFNKKFPFLFLLQHAIATDMLDDAVSMWNYTSSQDVCRVVYAWIVDMIQLVVTVTIVKKAFIVIQVNPLLTKRHANVSSFTGKIRFSLDLGALNRHFRDRFFSDDIIIEIGIGWRE
jgi:hypothetical protein